ncbi:MAG: hypothetical protein JXB48_13390 [Candidatus Latescibacteria bacterium]|nr:hypothetical protein [Candidatus Latescibacterota bacterium]
MKSDAVRRMFHFFIVLILPVISLSLSEKCTAQEYAAVNTVQGVNSMSGDSKKVLPIFRHGAYGNEYIELNNGHIQIILFRRINGWAWGEIYTPSGKFMAVLEHLGEVMLRDQDIPMRLEADSVYTKSGPEGKSFMFKVKSTVVREKLKGTSFEKWMLYPLEHPCVVGEVTLTISPDKPIIYIKYRLEGTANYFVRYIRGPWLRVGEESFGIKKDDAIFPGVEWLIDSEWSSGSDWFKYPWSERFVPHPNKVSIPLMALSYEGDGIGLAWEPNQIATRWFNFRTQRPQPVFAVPNFIDRMNNSLMGIMIPDASAEGEENKPYADIPLELRVGQMINFDAELWLSKGNSLNVVTDWVQRHGLPEPPEPKWPFEETLYNIAGAYNSNFWVEGKGFQGRSHVPGFLDRYVREHTGTKLGKALKEKIDWCNSQSNTKEASEDTVKNELIKQGDTLLQLQHEDGSYYFDPDGRHYVKDDFKVATSFIEPMGHAGDTALDLCMTPVPTLLNIAEKTGRQEYKEGARKALEYCISMTRPEGGDYWETPLHAPNLYAAGHAAIAYYLGYKAFGDERYKEKAIYWIRSLIPFTHLWETPAVNMMYNTKPCLCSSDWYFANWVRDHVQWEVLSVFKVSSDYGIKWEEVDPEIDWTRYFKGVTVAAIRWMHTSKDNDWRPHNLPETYEPFKNGEFDYCFADTHNSTTGNYGGAFIGPELIATNIYTILDRKW